MGYVQRPAAALHRRLSDGRAGAVNTVVEGVVLDKRGEAQRESDEIRDSFGVYRRIGEFIKAERYKDLGYATPADWWQGERIREHSQVAEADRKELVRALTGAGLSVRTTGAMLSISRAQAQRDKTGKPSNKSTTRAGRKKASPHPAETAGQDTKGGETVPSRWADGNQEDIARWRAWNDWDDALTRSRKWPSRPSCQEHGWEWDGSYERHWTTDELRGFAATDNPPCGLDDAALLEFVHRVYGLPDRKGRDAVSAILNNTRSPYLRCPKCLRGEAAPEPDQSEPETAGNEVAPPADVLTTLQAPVPDRTDPPEQVLTDRQRELLRNLSGTSDWVTASTLGAANGISQIADHLPGLIEKKDGGSEHWEGPLQVRLTEAGRQECARLWPPAPDPVPLADDEVREMLRAYLADLADSQQLANFAQEYLGGNRTFADPWPVVVARCWPAQPVTVDGVRIGTLSFTRLSMVMYQKMRRRLTMSPRPPPSATSHAAPPGLSGGDQHEEHRAGPRHRRCPHGGRLPAVHAQHGRLPGRCRAQCQRGTYLGDQLPAGLPLGRRRDLHPGERHGMVEAGGLAGLRGDRRLRLQHV